MAHDHGEKIHYCKECLYWHVANGRFDTCDCPKCGDHLGTYSSRDWIIEHVDERFKGIPKEKTRSFGADGFIEEKSCKKHPKSVGEYTDMKKLAEDIGDLHYDTLSELLFELRNKLERDSAADMARGRVKLSKYLLEAANGICLGEYQIYKAWRLCKPYMEEK